MHWSWTYLERKEMRFRLDLLQLLRKNRGRNYYVRDTYTTDFLSRVATWMEFSNHKSDGDGFCMVAEEKDVNQLRFLSNCLFKIF